MNLPSKLSKLLAEALSVEGLFLVQRAVLEASGGTAPPFTAFDEKLLPPEPLGASEKMQRYWSTYCTLLIQEHLETMTRAHAELVKASVGALIRGGRRTTAGRA